MCGLKLNYIYMINILTKEFDFVITNWYYKTILCAPNCNYNKVLL